MPQDLQNIFNVDIHFWDFLGNLLLSFICGLIISFVYKIVYKGTSYTPSYVQSLVLLCLITTIVIAVIGNNLARAFGLVGAMSIIRFRTAVRDITDIVFIFLSLSIGLAAGTGAKHFAIAGTLFTCIVILVLSKINFASPKRNEVLLQFSSLSDKNISSESLQILNSYCKSVKLINVKSNGGGNILESFYHVVIKDSTKSIDLIGKLNKIEGISNINLFFDKT